MICFSKYQPGIATLLYLTTFMYDDQNDEGVLLLAITKAVCSRPEVRMCADYPDFPR